MDLTEKNGHASIEEILASVRRIIAEEPGQAAPVIDLGKPSQYPGGDGLLDDPSDFDLPSMFKTPSSASVGDKPAPLFGRLSEAIRAASSNGQTLNGHANGHTPSHQNGDRAEHGLSSLNLHRSEPADAANAPSFLLSTFHEATAPRIDEIAASVTSDVKAAAHAPSLAPSPEANVMQASSTQTNPVPVPADPAPQVPRQMAAFKDTRFRGMGSSPAPAAPMQPAASPFEAAATAALVQAASSAAPMQPAISAEPESLALPVLMSEHDAASDDLVADEAPASLAAAIVASYPSLSPDPAPASGFIPEAPVMTAPLEHTPPPVPLPGPLSQDPAAAQAAPAPIEDSTADLLRPMLRQWLAENMPRMVEKALHIEVAESTKSPKK